MEDCFKMLKEKFPNVSIKYYISFGVSIIKCKSIENQLEDLKKILKTLIFEIQSKNIQKDVINIEFNDIDILSDNIEKLLNIMKFTKTSHYFNIMIKKSIVSEDEIANRISFIAEKYIGLNINKEINLNKGDNNEGIQCNRF